eukprot:6208707-Pleurochrysis_carterae.AAC.4
MSYSLKARVLAVKILDLFYRRHLCRNSVRILTATIRERKVIICHPYSSSRLALIAHEIEPVPRVLRNMRSNVENKFIAAYNYHLPWLLLGRLASTKP